MTEKELYEYKLNRIKLLEEYRNLMKWYILLEHLSGVQDILSYRMENECEYKYVTDYDLDGYANIYLERCTVTKKGTEINRLLDELSLRIGHVERCGIVFSEYHIHGFKLEIFDALGLEY